MSPIAIPIGWRTTWALIGASLVGALAFAWPLVAEPDSLIVTNYQVAPWAFALLVPGVLIVVAAQFADGSMDAKSVAMIGVLSAVIAALRPLGTGVAGIEPIWAVLILGGFALGPGFGFVLGAVSLFASALVTGGVGPWLPFQMLAAAWIGLGAGLLARAPAIHRLQRRWGEILILAGYGAAAALCFGLVMNLWFWPFTVGLDPSVSFVPGDPLNENVMSWLRFSVLTSLGFDIPRAVLACALILIAGKPILIALRRASRQAAFGASPDFVSEPHSSARIARVTDGSSARTIPTPATSTMTKPTDD